MILFSVLESRATEVPNALKETSQEKREETKVKRVSEAEGPAFARLGGSFCEPAFEDRAVLRAHLDKLHTHTYSAHVVCHAT